MNGARLGIMAQAVGLSEAAYREAYAYALDRKQFGKSIIEFPAIAEIIALMRAKADASVLCYKRPPVSLTRLQSVG